MFGWCYHVRGCHLRHAHIHPAVTHKHNTQSGECLWGIAFEGIICGKVELIYFYRISWTLVKMCLCACARTHTHTHTHTCMHTHTHARTHTHACTHTIKPSSFSQNSFTSSKTQPLRTRTLNQNIHHSPPPPQPPLPPTSHWDFQPVSTTQHHPHLPKLGVCDKELAWSCGRWRNGMFTGLEEKWLDTSDADNSWSVAAVLQPWWDGVSDVLRTSGLRALCCGNVEKKGRLETEEERKSTHTHPPK